MSLLINLFLSSVLLASVGTAHAADQNGDVTSFGVVQGSKDWKEQQLEEWLVWQTSKDLAQFVSPELFNVYVDIEMKNERNTIRTVSNVNLSMFGTVAKIVKRDVPKPNQGLFGQIAKMDVTLVVADRVHQSTVDAMVQIIRKRVPFVEPHRITASVVKVDPPSLGVVGWLREMKNIIGSLLFLGVLFVGVSYLLKNAKFHGVIRIGTSPVEAKEVTVAGGTALVPGATKAVMLPMELLSQGFTLEDVPEVEGDEPSDLDKTMLAETETALELRRIRTLLLGMSIEECINVCRSEAFLGAIVTTLLTPEKARKVTSRLSPEVKHKIVLETVKFKPAEVARDAKGIIDRIKLHKYEKVSEKGLKERLSVYLDQVGPEGEEKVFDELLKTGRTSDFAWLVRDALPTRLLEYVPDALIKSVLSHMPYNDQVEILAFSPKEIVDRVWRLLPTNTLGRRALVEADVTQRQKSVQFGDPVSHQALGILLTVVREALRTNQEWYNFVKPHVEQFIFQRTKGLEGSSHGRAA
jgi:hypothetical protein